MLNIEGNNWQNEGDQVENDKLHVEKQDETQERKDVALDIKELFESLENFALKNNLSLHSKSSDRSQISWYSEVKKWPNNPDDKFSGVQLRLELNIQLEGGHGWIILNSLALKCNEQQRQWLEEGIIKKPWEDLATRWLYPPDGHNTEKIFFSFEARKEGDNLQTDGVSDMRPFLNENENLTQEFIEGRLTEVVAEWQKV